MPRGGSRKGAGRPKQRKEPTEKARKDFAEAAKWLRAEFGITPEQVTLGLSIGLVFNPTTKQWEERKVQATAKIAALKIYSDTQHVKEKQTIEHKTDQGVIVLPAIREKSEEVKEFEAEWQKRQEEMVKH